MRRFAVIVGLALVGLLPGGCKTCRYVPVTVEVREREGDAPVAGAWVRALNADPRPLAEVGCRGRIEEPWVETDAAGRATVEMERSGPVGVLVARDRAGTAPSVYTAPGGSLRWSLSPADLFPGTTALLSSGHAYGGVREGAPPRGEGQPEHTVRVWRE